MEGGIKMEGCSYCKCDTDGLKMEGLNSSMAGSKAQIPLLLKLTVLKLLERINLSCVHFVKSGLQSQCDVLVC